MNKNHKFIFNKINKLIKTSGIPYYLKKWKPYKMKEQYKNDTDFINDLVEYIKTYHNHSGIMYKGKYVPSKKQIIEKKMERMPNEKYLKKRAMPTFSFSNKIGKIEFFQFIGINDKDQTRLVKLVKKNISDWKRNGMIGLILDFRHHYGGNVFPLYYAFSDLFNNSTIYSWHNKKAKKNDKVWVNIKNGKVKHDQKFLSNKLNFDYPIAIIIGKNTSSSGEFGSLMFYGRDNVKFFGNSTSGALSGNVVIKINADIEFIFTISLVNTVDGTFHVKEKIYPNKRTTKPITDARKWINLMKN